MYWYLFDLSSVIYGALPQTPLKELLQKFLKNLQKLFKIKGFSNVIMHFSPTARAQSVRDQTVLITPLTHSLKSIISNRRSWLALSPSRAQTLACAAFSLRDIMEILFDVIFCIKNVYLSFQILIYR